MNTPEPGRLIQLWGKGLMPFECFGRFGGSTFMIQHPDGSFEPDRFVWLDRTSWEYVDCRDRTVNNAIQRSR